MQSYFHFLRRLGGVTNRGNVFGRPVVGTHHVRQGSNCRQASRGGVFQPARQTAHALCQISAGDSSQMDCSRVACSEACLAAWHRNDMPSNLAACGKPNCSAAPLCRPVQRLSATAMEGAFVLPFQGPMDNAQKPASSTSILLPLALSLLKVLLR